MGVPNGISTKYATKIQNFSETDKLFCEKSTNFFFFIAFWAFVGRFESNYDTKISPSLRVCTGYGQTLAGSCTPNR